MNLFNDIQEQINLQKELAYEDEMVALAELQDQFFRAAHSRWSFDELTNFIKYKNDVLENFDQNSSFFEDVRNIQDQIISAFSE